MKHLVFRFLLSLFILVALTSSRVISSSLAFEDTDASFQSSTDEETVKSNTESTKEENEENQETNKEEAEKEKESDNAATQNDKAEVDEKAVEKKEKSDEEDKEEEKDEDEEKDEKDKPKPFKVEAKPLKIEVKLDGFFVANEMEEVIVRPEVWTKFKVLEAVPHGTHVKKGDVLVRFDPEDLEKELAEESIDQRLSELALLQAEEEHPRDRRLAELAYEKAKRQHGQLLEDFDYYQNTDRPFYVSIAHYRYKNAQEDLASAQEELNQLQQMYEADEITEETEEIVLRRQQFVVETAELVLELALADRDYTLNVTLPRRDEFYRTMLEQSDLEFEQAKTAWEKGSSRDIFQMEKRRQTRAKSVERHAKLISDKSLMEIRSPMDGVVYYGKCSDGKWSQVATLEAKLKPFGTVTPRAVMMTIVKQRPLHIESSIGEKDIPDMKKGLSATITPTADEELELTGKIAELQTIPGKGNKFSVKLDFEHESLPDWLVAGMSCKASVTTYENNTALQIPQDLVQSDEDNEKIKYVMLVDPEEDAPIRRQVKLGRKLEKMVEVLHGLSEGDEIVKEEKKEEEED